MFVHVSGSGMVACVCFTYVCFCDFVWLGTVILVCTWLCTNLYLPLCVLGLSVYMCMCVCVGGKGMLACVYLFACVCGKECLYMTVCLSVFLFML